MTPELQIKVERAIRLLQSVAPIDGSPVEVAYSGGKDSDVILELTKMAGINYRAIYKNTTIDPPGTIKHCEEKGVEIIKPKKTFFQLVSEKGYPSRFVRFCCSELKEYPILNKQVIGVRKEESSSRAVRYNEPTQCRVYGKCSNDGCGRCVEVIYPLLDWTNENVSEFIAERGIKCHPLYYDDQGNFRVERRLGCMCCPLIYKKKRIAEFQKYPGMVKAYIRAGQKYRDTHPDTKFTTSFDNIYDAFVCFLFYDSKMQWEQSRNGLFEPVDSKAFLEETFNIKL